MSSGSRSGDRPDQSQPAGPARPTPACCCGSTDIAAGLALKVEDEQGRLGIKYLTGKTFLVISLGGTEPVRADVCNVCGTIVRFYVDNPKRNWI